MTALVLSAVLWAAVAAEEPTTQLVAVRLIVEPPPGRTVTQELPVVRALFAGTARELIKLYSTPPVVRHALPDSLTGSTFRLILSPADVRFAQDIDATPQDIQPRVLNVSLDDVARRAVGVTSRVRIAPDPGYALVGPITITPSRVALRGPEAALRNIDNVPTVGLDLRGVDAPVRRTIRLDTTGLGIARVEPTTVEISADVVPVSERVLMGVPVTVRADRGGLWVTDPPAVIVTVRGPSARLLHLTRDSISVIASVSGDDGALVRLELVPPRGITGTLTPDSVTVQPRPRG